MQKFVVTIKEHPGIEPRNDEKAPIARPAVLVLLVRKHPYNVRKEIRYVLCADTLTPTHAAIRPKPYLAYRYFKNLQTKVQKKNLQAVYEEKCKLGEKPHIQQ